MQQNQELVLGEQKRVMTEQTGVRINKYIADAGVCSRREADRLVEQGRVSADGRAAEKGTRILPGMCVTVDGKEIRQSEKKVYLAFHKPKGIVCTSEKREKDNVIDFIGYPARITYCGRLDKDSEGLLLLTNDGSIINQMMRAANYHEKEYVVTIDRPVTKEFLKQMRTGVYLDGLDTVTRPCAVKKTAENTFHMILTQGLNRQIRRMCEALGCRVVKLCRIRVMNILLGDLPAGTYRELSETELMELRKEIMSERK